MPAPKTMAPTSTWYDGRSANIAFIGRMSANQKGWCMRQVADQKLRGQGQLMPERLDGGRPAPQQRMVSSIMSKRHQPSVSHVEVKKTRWPVEPMRS